MESLIQAIAVLNGEGHVLPAQSEAVIDRVRDRCTALNESLMRQACYRKRIGCLASPVTGAGIPVKRIEQLFLLAHRGSMPMAQWPGFATATMLANGGAMKINGESITDPKQVLMETTRRAEAFIADRLPILASLGIV